MKMTSGPLMIFGALVLAACSSTSPAGAAPTDLPTRSPTLTKPSFAQAPLPGPTYVRWAVDKSGFPDRPYFLDFFYDGVATSFRVVDASGQVMLRVPIAGSGVFGPETCVQRARSPGKTEGFTYLVVDAATLQGFMANAASYRIEADSVERRAVTIPLSDSGCRPL